MDTFNRPDTFNFATLTKRQHALVLKMRQERLQRGFEPRGIRVFENAQ